MDATRARRTRDQARQGWYARYRQWRFARYLGFGDGIESPASRPVAARPPRIDRSAIGLLAGDDFVDYAPSVASLPRQAPAFALAAR